MVNVEEAWSQICAVAKPLPTEMRRLTDAAGYVLAQPVRAPIDLPPFDNSAMDGYALRAADTIGASALKPVALNVLGEVAAGGWREEPVAPGTATKIMTGAAVPPGADAILTLEAGRLRHGVVEIREPVPPGARIRRRGEDVRGGQTLLEAGMRLNVQRIGLLASSGMVEVCVHRQARVGLLATGSELVMDGKPLKPGQIYDSNRIILRMLIERAGGACHDLGVAPDEPDRIAERIQSGLSSDVLLISGGVSVGAHDHVKAVLRELEVETIFWRVNMKPGKPLFCGRRDGRWVFGLPGNPISCVVGFLMLIEPLVRRLQGEEAAQARIRRARLACPVTKHDPRTVLMTASMEEMPDGMWQVMPTEQQGSAMMQALAQANAFVIVPAAHATLNAGELVEVLVVDA